VARTGDKPFLPGASMLSDVHRVRPEDDLRASFYVRFVVRDQSGIVGEICQIFGDKQINVSEIWQLEHTEEELESLVEAGKGRAASHEMLPFVITLEETSVGLLRQALERIAQKDFVLAEPLWLPIWTA
jgi:hypothetical protein